MRERFGVTTRAGRRLGADIWFRCFGVVPSTGSLADELVGARRPDGHLEVTHEPAAPAIALPLGPKSGVSYTAELGVLDAATTSEIKALR